MISTSHYPTFREAEQHFNTIQAGIRNIASGWMLAAFGAIAVLLQMDEKTTWMVPPMVLVVVVSFMATAGLLVLWICDQMVYQRLLNAVFLLGLKWEYDNPELPPVRAMMMHTAEGRGMSRWMTLYYTIPMWAFLVTSIVSGALLWKTTNDVLPGETIVAKIAVCVLFALQASAALWLQFKKEKVESRSRAAQFGDNTFAAMFSGDDHGRKLFVDMIQRHVTPKAGDPPLPNKS